MFQYESSREIQVEKDSNATATLETETEFTRDAHAIIRERELKQAAEELKGGESKTGGDEKLYKGINGCTDYKAGFRREQTVGSEKAGESHGPLRASDYQPDICNGTAMNKPRNNQKKKRKVSPEVQFRIDLDQCSKTKDLPSAQALFKSIPSTLKLGPHHYNSFLYICSSALSSEAHDEAKRASAVEFGFSVYAHMVSSRTPSNEATATAMARLAAAKGDGDMAFEMAKGVGREGKLRTFAPALFSYCANGEEEKGYRVEDYMINIGLHLEEPELSALFKVSVEKGREQKIYEYLHKLRNFVRAVDVSTAEIIQSWFGREEASCVGLDKWDEVQVKEAIVKNGGGWHGTGWLGKGKWLVQKSNISSDGRCFSCSEQLVCVDASREETGKFSQSVASLAKEREVEAHFSEFQDWLDEHSDYESIVDGANVGLYQQNFADGGFSMTQLDAVVKEVYNRSKKWPLVVLHSKRVHTLFEDVANRELLEKWEEVGALYATPYGSNDDWYWLYAAVKLKCLLVTNDEMRDHIFELFGSSFFSTWKERHQVRYTFVKGNLKLVMPPPYSLVIQESEKGSWHVPLGGENSDESSRTWLCITRHGSSEASAKVSSIISQHRRDDQTSASNLEEAINKNGENGRSDSSHVSASIDLPVAGKRKEG